MEDSMDASPLWRLRIPESEIKEIIAKHLKEEKGYFVYPEMIDIVPLTNSKYEILVKAATKID
jgi:hypothetical protein